MVVIGQGCRLRVREVRRIPCHHVNDLVSSHAANFYNGERVAISQNLPLTSVKLPRSLKSKFECSLLSSKLSLLWEQRDALLPAALCPTLFFMRSHTLGRAPPRVPTAVCLPGQSILVSKLHVYSQVSRVDTLTLEKPQPEARS